MKRLLICLLPVLIGCGPSRMVAVEMTVSHVSKESGFVEIFARKSYAVYRAKFEAGTGADTLKRGDKIQAMPCTKKLHDSCCHVEFKRIK